MPHLPILTLIESRRYEIEQLMCVYILYVNMYVYAQV